MNPFDLDYTVVLRYIYQQMGSAVIKFCQFEHGVSAPCTIADATHVFSNSSHRSPTLKASSPNRFTLERARAARVVRIMWLMMRSPSLFSKLMPLKSPRLHIIDAGIQYRRLELDEQSEMCMFPCMFPYVVRYAHIPPPRPQPSSPYSGMA